ncbi:protection of telomeres protein 1a-like [Papaver somniferum]|uniref:protection of telomeres protein 1a-like n=1 Tax=Papaver somniferum TaxID=3469 RepID=UPI000E703B67|nr:protection of telomeres protein 1a-like [Papaver somniferum]
MMGGEFTPLIDAPTRVETEVNLIGSVVEIGLRRQSRGTDFVYTLKIVDERFMDTAFAINFFAEKVEYFPLVGSVGDLLLVFNVKIKKSKEEFYGLFQKRESSFALYDGKPGDECAAYCVSPLYRVRNWHIEGVKVLRTWLTTFQLGAGTNKKLRPIKEMNMEEFDLICKVLHSYEVSASEWTLLVWDGTDTPALNYEITLSDAAEMQLPLEPANPPLSRDVRRNFPTVGSILRVSVKCIKFDAHLVCGGQWVRLRAVTCRRKSSFWGADLTDNSKIRFLSDTDSTVIHRLGSYNDRISSYTGRVSAIPSPITEIISVSGPLVTLLDVVNYSEVTAKFKCVVRVVGAYSCCAENFRETTSGKYVMRFTLEDPTARIHAYLYDEDGVKFFGGYPTVDVLRKKRNELLGIDDEVEENKRVVISPPWIQCCLKSYYLDKNDQWGSRTYRIFGTKLVDYTIA